MVKIVPKENFEFNPKQEKGAKILADPDKTRVLFRGGSRSGKTFLFVYAIIVRALKCKSKHLLTRFRFRHAKQSLWYETIPDVFSTCFPGMDYYENKSDWFIELKNGSQLWLGGVDEKERTEKILGNEYSTIFFNEVSQIKWNAVILALTRLAEKTDLVNKAYFDCNPPSIHHWSYKIWFEGKDPKTNAPLKDKKRYASIQMNPTDNTANLADDYIEGTLKNLTGADKQRFLEGKYVKDIAGALWSGKYINKYRVEECPPLRRKAIAIDPAVTSKEDSDETGIIAGGRGVDGDGYVTDDLSGKYSPAGWARKVINLYHEGEYDVIVAETNNGGDMVEHTLRSIDPTVNFKQVKASRGKIIRAEPVQGMYEQGKIHHVDELPGLETQMTTWDTSQEDSPDRVDGLVWLLTELMFGQSIGISN